MQSDANKLTVRWQSRRDQWLADSEPIVQATRHEVSSGISSKSWLTPIGAKFVLVQQRVTRQTRKYPAKKVVLANTRRRSKIVAGGKLGAVNATHDANPADRRVCAIGRELSVLDDGVVRTLQHGRRDAIGELPTRICGSVAVEVACPSGRCYYPRLGLVALCTSGSALVLKSETVTIMTRTCRCDGGKTALREARKKIVNVLLFHPLSPRPPPSSDGARITQHASVKDHVELLADGRDAYGLCGCLHRTVHLWDPCYAHPQEVDFVVLNLRYLTNLRTRSATTFVGSIMHMASCFPERAASKRSADKQFKRATFARHFAVRLASSFSPLAKTRPSSF